MSYPLNMRRWPNVGLLLGRRRSRRYIEIGTYYPGLPQHNEFIQGFRQRGGGRGEGFLTPPLSITGGVTPPPLVGKEKIYIPYFCVTSVKIGHFIH